MELHVAGNGEIAFSDVSGEMGIIKNFINEANLDDDSSDEADNHVDFGNIEIKSDDDEENENAVSLEKLKREVMGEEEPELNFGRGVISFSYVYIFFTLNTCINYPIFFQDIIYTLVHL